MNRFAPYAALVLRLAVGGVFLHHGIGKLQGGLAGVSGFMHTLGIPFATLSALVVMAVETVGAVGVLLGVATRIWAACMSVEMVVAILVANIPAGRGFELEGLLLAGSLALVALGDGPISVGRLLPRSG